MTACSTEARLGVYFGSEQKGILQVVTAIIADAVESRKGASGGFKV